MMPETERIAAALEPELRRVIDMTMERIVEIEQETMRGAREMMVSAGENSQAALDRSSRVVTSLDALDGTVSRVTSALRAEVDDVAAALRGLHRLQVELPEEILPGRAETEAEAEPEPAEPPPSEAHDPGPPATEAHAEPAPPPDPEIEPSPELTEMFREQITRMRDDGKPRDEAERVLLRFRLGYRFLGMLDEIYLTGPSSGRGRGRRGLFERFRRRA
jgi:hypothetical protein